MTKNGRNKPSKQQNQKKQEKKQFSLKKKAETMRKNQENTQKYGNFDTKIRFSARKNAKNFKIKQIFVQINVMIFDRKLNHNFDIKFHQIPLI